MGSSLATVLPVKQALFASSVCVVMEAAGAGAGRGHLVYGGQPLGQQVAATVL